MKILTKISIILFCIFVSKYTVAQTKTKKTDIVKLDTAEIIDFIKWDLTTQWDSSGFDKQKNIVDYIVRYDSFSSIYNTKLMLNYINKKQIKYLIAQSKYREGGKWPILFLPTSIKILPASEETIKNPFSTDTVHSYNSYSLPLITKDKKIVIVRKYYYCGELCGWGCDYIYKKTGKHKWKLATKYWCWVS